MSTILPFINDVKPAVKAWVDNFPIHTDVESRSEKHVDMSLRICDDHGRRTSAMESTIENKMQIVRESY